MKHIYLVILIFFNISYLFCQDIRPEKIYQDCKYSSLIDKGKLLKKYTKDFESHLIKSKVLKDETSNSYFELFKELSNGKWKHFKYSYSYVDSIKKIEAGKILNIDGDCAIKMRNLEDYKESKIFKMKELLNEKDKTIESILKKMAFLLEEKDFELDFYKHRTFIFLQMLPDFED